MSAEQTPLPLDAESIRSRLGPAPRSLLENLQVHQTIDSTNAHLLRERPPLNGAHVCTAEQQTAGRGRRGREWVSPSGHNVYCSIAWPVTTGMERLGGLSLMVGVALCEALEQHGVQSLGLKWPNDVLVDGAKLAGILVETRSESSSALTAVIGVGVNGLLPEQEATAIGQAWTDLHALGVVLDRNEFLADFLGILLPALVEFEQHGFRPWRDGWQARHSFAGRPVLVSSAERSVAGTALGVDDDGALLLETSVGVQRIHGGEVSLRAQP